MLRSLLLSLLLLPLLASAGTVTITWTAPTSTCADGSPISNCVTTGFKIYGALCGQPKVLVATPAATATAQVLANVAPGNQCYDMTTLAGTAESVHTAEVSKLVPNPLPNPPTIKTIDATAYEIRTTSTSVAAVRVGVTPLGVPCLDEFKIVAGVKYNKIDSVVVDLVNWPAAPNSYNVWAKCGPPSG
jgi:hypothetical protein